jgi:hypothetical protein
MGNRTMRFRSVALMAMLACIVSVARAHGDEDHSKDDRKPITAASVTLGEAPQRQADGSLYVPKSVQRQLGLRTQLSKLGEVAAAVELNGTVIADPNSSGRVQATHTGSVMPGPQGMPVAGRKVKKGEVLAYLRPVSSAIERGNQQSQLAELEAQFLIAERKLARYDQLEGAVPQKEIDTARVERAALEKRRAFVNASINAAEPLLASATGVISASHHLVAGQIVDAKEVLFEIVDPAHLAVEALAYDASIVKTLVSASALAEKTTLELKFVGGGQQLREQALPLLFRITTRNAAVAVGQPVRVIVRTAQGIKGAAVPRAALTKGGAGDTVVWVHTEAERFVARRVRHQALDATSIAITEGLAEGDRVVIDGAGLLSQVR